AFLAPEIPEARERIECKFTGALQKRLPLCDAPAAIAFIRPANGEFFVVLFGVCICGHGDIPMVGSSVDQEAISTVHFIKRILPPYVARCAADGNVFFNFESHSVVLRSCLRGGVSRNTGSAPAADVPAFSLRKLATGCATARRS